MLCKFLSIYYYYDIMDNRNIFPMYGVLEGTDFELCILCCIKEVFLSIVAGDQIVRVCSLTDYFLVMVFLHLIN